MVLGGLALLIVVDLWTVNKRYLNEEDFVRKLRHAFAVERLEPSPDGVLIVARVHTVEQSNPLESEHLTTLSLNGPPRELREPQGPAGGPRPRAARCGAVASPARRVADAPKTQ